MKYWLNNASSQCQIIMNHRNTLNATSHLLLATKNIRSRSIIRKLKFTTVRVRAGLCIHIRTTICLRRMNSQTRISGKLKNMHRCSGENYIRSTFIVAARTLSSTDMFQINIRHNTLSISSEMIQIWDSTKGADNSEIKLLEAIIPHERKALALKLFHENDYQIGGKIHFFHRTNLASQSYH